MKTLKTALQNSRGQLVASGVVAVSAMGTSVVNASAAAETAITGAIADGTSMVGLIGPGVIGIAALMLGVGIAVAWIKK